MKVTIETANSIRELHELLRAEGKTLRTIIKELEETEVSDRETFKRLFHTSKDLELYLNFLPIDAPIPEPFFEFTMENFSLFLGDKSLVAKDYYPWSDSQKERILSEFLKIQNFRQYIKTPSDLYIFFNNFPLDNFPVLNTYFKDPTLLDEAYGYHVKKVLNPLLEAEGLPTQDVPQLTRTENEIVSEAYRVVYSRTLVVYSHTLGTDYTKRALGGLFSQPHGNLPALPSEVGKMIGNYLDRLSGGAAALACTNAGKAAGTDQQFQEYTCLQAESEPEENNSMRCGG